MAKSSGKNVSKPSSIVLSVTGFSLESKAEAYKQAIVKSPTCTIQHRLAYALDIVSNKPISAEASKALKQALCDLYVAEADSSKAETASKILLAGISKASDLNYSFEVAYGKAYFSDCKSSGSVGKTPEAMLIALFKLTLAEVKLLAEAIITMRRVKASIVSKTLYVKAVGNKATSASKASINFG
jgi:hypothetical protein